MIGGSLGGVAAALAACDAGATVLLSEATDWLGGQATSQGVAALDEHRHIEAFGATRTYAALRTAIRDHYRARYGVTAMPDGRPLNPGNAWVSDLCFEPRVAVDAIERMLAPHVASGRLTILRGHAPVAAAVAHDTIQSVELRPVRGGPPTTVAARLFLDATDLGDLLPLVGAEYVCGAESRADTGEAGAPVQARPGEVQGFTFCFAVEHCPGEDHTIPKPDGYEQLRDRQPFTLTLQGWDGAPRPFKVFAQGDTGLPPFWTYRRLLDGALLDPSGATRDVALINWNSNDYHHASIVDVPPTERDRALDEARRLSLAFLYWLQTEAPRDDGSGAGYPGLRLLPEVMGTADGLAKAPYIRESRRIIAQRRVVAEDILAAGRSGARAAHFADSVGIGWYFMDLHPAVGSQVSTFTPTLPFQIPLGALVPRRVRNLLAACKNIGVTHLSNGSYRLHPVEWNIGESAGVLAALSLQRDITPAAIGADRPLLLELQRSLLARGVPLAWAIDMPEAHPAYTSTQLLLARGALAAGTPRFDSLEIRPAEPLTGAESAALLRALCELAGSTYRSIPPRWETDPADLASHGEWEPALTDAGLGHGPLSDPPTWAELCMAAARQ